MQSVNLTQKTQLKEVLTPNDGKIAAFLLFLLVFGPDIIITRSLPPFRVVDIVILILLLSRFEKSHYLHSGFIFSKRSRIVTSHLAIFTFTVLLSFGVNTMVLNRYPFFYKDLFTPIVFIRMMLIAAVFGSFSMGERHIKHLIFGVLLISFLMAAVAFGQKFKVSGVIPLIQGLYPASQAQMHTLGREILFSRVTGTFGNPNVFGGATVMISAFLLNCSLHLKGTIRGFCFSSYLLLAVVLIVTTGSRTSLIGLAAITVLSVLFSLRRGSTKTAVFVGSILLLLALILPTFLPHIPVNPRLQKFMTDQQSAMDSQSLLTRIKMWNSRWNLVKGSILIGRGPTKTETQLTDNGYLYTLFRVGLLGLIVYLSMLGNTFIKGLTTLRKVDNKFRRGALLGLTLVIVNHAVFEMTGEFFWNIRYGALLSAMMGLLCAVCADVSFDREENRVQPAINSIPNR